jgi:hypothetical protein
VQHLPPGDAAADAGPRITAGRRHGSRAVGRLGAPGIDVVGDAHALAELALEVGLQRLAVQQVEFSSSAAVVRQAPGRADADREVPQAGEAISSRIAQRAGVVARGCRHAPAPSSRSPGRAPALRSSSAEVDSDRDRGGSCVPASSASSSGPGSLVQHERAAVQ